MTKSPAPELPRQTNEESTQRHRNAYDYDGEYEFPTAQHLDRARRSRFSRLTSLGAFCHILFPQTAHKCAPPHFAAPACDSPTWGKRQMDGAALARTF
jgi:hypothetical protein